MLKALVAGALVAGAAIALHAQAIAIRGDRFVAVGSNQDITKLAGPNTRRIDLGGKAVIPGLIDAPYAAAASTRGTR